MINDTVIKDYAEDYIINSEQFINDFDIDSIVETLHFVAFVNDMPIEQYADCDAFSSDDFVEAFELAANEVCKEKSKTIRCSFLNYNCLLHRLAKGASTHDFVMCYLCDGKVSTCPIDSAVCDYWVEPLFHVHAHGVLSIPVVFLGYSRRGTL